jgi:hypothetical protein
MKSEISLAQVATCANRRSGLEIGTINPEIIGLYPKSKKGDYVADNKLK